MRVLERRVRPWLLVITGPTGCGKSELAMQLADRLQTRRPVELISVDSAQVYRGMDVGTAKPDRLARERVPHHLLDIRDPAESYSAGEFVHDARAAIDAIVRRNHQPVLVGGTMLYLRALRAGLAVLPPASAAVRGAIDEEAAARGWPALHAELARVDDVAARRIAPQDAQRVQRALEVFRLTGVPISVWQREGASASDEYRWLRYALLPASRDELRARLGQRLDGMLRSGLVAEVQQLYARGDLTPRHPAVRAVGYRQLWQYCAGQCSLEQARDAALTATAQLAKRQLTWLRRETDLTLLSANTVGLAEQLLTQIVAATGA